LQNVPFGILLDCIRINAEWFMCEHRSGVDATGKKIGPFILMIGPKTPSQCFCAILGVMRPLGRIGADCQRTLFAGVSSCSSFTLPKSVPAPWRPFRPLTRGISTGLGAFCLWCRYSSPRRRILGFLPDFGCCRIQASGGRFKKSVLSPPWEKRGQGHPL
jgi:hypothetical protein